MKAIFPLLILLAIPVLLSVILFTVLIPLAYRHFFSNRRTETAFIEFPYQTSWEEAA